MRRLIPHITVYQPNGWSNSILPIDVLHKLVNEMNGVIDIINHMEDESVAHAKEYTDSQIDIVDASIATTNNNLYQINLSLQASIRSLNQSITVLDSEVDTLVERINATDGRVTENYNTFTSAMTQVYRDLNSTATQLRNYADLKDTVLREQLESEIEELRHVINDILEVETIDGLTGLKRTVRQILSTYIIDKVKHRGGNRYAMTWGHFSLTGNNGWFNKNNYLGVNNWNIFAPTWFNFMIATDSYFKNASYPLNRSYGTLNTWGAFCNDTLLYIGVLISNMLRLGNYAAQAGTIGYRLFNWDVFDYSEWNTYKYSTTAALPTYSTMLLNAVYSGSATYNNLLLDQFRLYCKNLSAAMNSWLYTSSSSSRGYLFDASHQEELFMFLYGIDNTKYFSDMY